MKNEAKRAYCASTQMLVEGFIPREGVIYVWTQKLTEKKHVQRSLPKLVKRYCRS